MPLMNGSSKKAFGHNVGAEERAGKPRDQALAIAYSVKRRAKKAHGGMMDEHYAKGGMADNEKLHPDHEPFGIKSTHDIVHEIMRRRQGPQSPEYLDDGGQAGMDQRVAQRMGERGDARNLMDHPSIAPGKYNFSEPMVITSDKAAQMHQADLDNAAMQDRVDQRMNQRAQMKAYGGEVTDEPEGKDDFLGLAEHDGARMFHEEQETSEDPKTRRRKLLSGIMSDLHNEHYGR